MSDDDDDKLAERTPEAMLASRPLCKMKYPPRDPGLLTVRFENLDETQVRAAFAPFGDEVEIGNLHVEDGFMTIRVAPDDEQVWKDRVLTFPGFTYCSDASQGPSRG